MADGDRWQDDAVDRIWARITATLAARREDLDCFLTQLGADQSVDRSPVRVLVASDTEAARVLLAQRIATDDRFALVGEAARPADLLAEGVSGLPDVVVVKLATTDRAWLDALGELSAWSPRTRMLAVSGVHADHLAELVLTPAVAAGLAAARPPSAHVAAMRPGETSATASARSKPSSPTAAAPRSLIHEVMRQVGIPVRSDR
jgi:hypothetical protein